MSDRDEYQIEAQIEDIRARFVAFERPDSYKDPLEWAENFVAEVEKVADTTPQRRRLARRQWAEQKIRSWDGGAARSANAFFRRVYMERQLPLEWKDVLNLPIVIDHEKFRFGSCTHELIERAAIAERRQAGREFRAREEAVEGREMLARWVKLSGEKVDDLDPALCAWDDEDESS